MQKAIPKQTFLSYYEQYKDKIYNYLWYRVGFRREVAEDLTSEIFIKALNHFDDFDQTRSFQSWIYQIAHNHLVNYYKKNNREVDLETASLIFEEPLKNIELSLEHQKILAVIDKLPESQRQIIQLRFIDELDFSEISKILDKEEGAVRTQLSRAMSYLRSLAKENILMTNE